MNIGFRLLVALLILLLPIGSEAKRQRLKLPTIKETSANSKPDGKKKENCKLVVSPNDSIRFASLSAKISFSGYDKRNNSAYESFFITNSSECDSISGLDLEIEYMTVNGRTFHKRNASLKIEVPPGETRKADIKSWDRQKSFYYYKSQQPRSSATPFKVIFKITGITVTNTDITPKTQIVD